jgi:exonuclease III
MIIMLLPSSIMAVKIVSWNVLDFYGALSSDRIEDFRMVLDELKPDILVVQDMGDLKGVNLFLKEVLNHSKRLYKKAKFADQTDTASALFYNRKTIKFKSIEEIPTLSRSVWGYDLMIKKGDGKGKTLSVYSVHLPEGSNTAAKVSRASDAEIIRVYLNNKHTPGDFFVVCGTFNLWTTKEAAFKALTENAQINNGRVFDPLDVTGKWHRKKKLADTHTESTRKIVSGVGAAGGLDDRYDNFFISQGIVDSEKFTYIEGSYLAYGNDGKHFRKAVTIPTNKVVSQDMAEALYRASDHLPIVMALGLPVGDAPFAPTQLTAEALTSAQVKLTWIDNADNEDGFHLARARNCSACHGNSHCTACHMGNVPPIPTSPKHEFGGHAHSWSQITTLNANVKTHTDSGLSSGATYSYRVRAYNAKGPSAYSNTASVTTNSASVSSNNQEK